MLTIFYNKILIKGKIMFKGIVGDFIKNNGQNVILFVMENSLENQYVSISTVVWKFLKVIA